MPGGDELGRPDISQSVPACDLLTAVPRGLFGAVCGGGGGKVTRLGRREVIRSGVFSQGNLSGSNWWGLMVESSNAGQRLARKGARKVARLALFSLC